MRIEIRPGFNRDIRRLRGSDTLHRVARTIADLEDAPAITTLPNVLRLTSARGHHLPDKSREIPHRCNHRRRSSRLSQNSTSARFLPAISVTRAPYTISRGLVRANAATAISSPPHSLHDKLHTHRQYHEHKQAHYPRTPHPAGETRANLPAGYEADPREYECGEPLDVA